MERILALELKLRPVHIQRAGPGDREGMGFPSGAGPALFKGVCKVRVIHMRRYAESRQLAALRKSCRRLDALH